MTKPKKTPSQLRALHNQRVPIRRGRARGGVGIQLKIAVAGLAVLFALLVMGGMARRQAPAGNTNLSQFDAIIVLGYPDDDEGNPQPRQLARVTETVHEYERGAAAHIIVTGGAAHNQYVEAETMARTAIAQGVPASVIVKETSAQDTIQNACFATRIMRAHGWRSAEVVSSASHLPRAGMIFAPLPIQWRTHAAPELEPESAAYRWAENRVEELKTARYLLWSRWRERCEP